MEKETYLKRLREGSETWNQWRSENHKQHPDLSSADLRGTDLSGADLKGAILKGADLHGADLGRADLAGADLCEANLSGSHLEGADLSWANLNRANLRGAFLNRACLSGAHLLKANLNQATLSLSNFSGAALVEADLNGANLAMADFREATLIKAHLCWANLSHANFDGGHLQSADLTGANLTGTIFSHADLSDADLSHATMVRSGLQHAKLNDCRIYGISSWNPEFSDRTEQRDLILAAKGHPVIAVDHLDIGLFLSLLLSSGKLETVFETAGRSIVLILGRFGEERKPLLNALRGKLRALGWIPLLFDFERPTQRDFQETIRKLARLSRFVLADISNPKSSPLDLSITLPDYDIPLVPLCDENEDAFPAFRDLQDRYEWALPVLEYDSPSRLIEVLENAVVQPALEKSGQLALKRRRDFTRRHVSDFREK